MGNEVSGETILVTVCVLMGISTLAVTGRCYTRFRVTRDGGADDWLILAALAGSLGMTTCLGMEVRRGLGSTKGVLSTTRDPKLLQAFWAAIWTYHLAMGLCRLSVVLQYLRIFPQASRGWVKWLMWALAIANGLNMIWATMSSILTCVPASKYWNLAEEGHCMNLTILYLTNSTLAMLSDFAIAVLPIPWIRSLRLPFRQKLLVCGIFVLAGFPCILAAIRVQALIEVTSDMGSDYADGILGIFSCAEVYAAVICACLPSLKAFWNHLRPRVVRRSHAICQWLPCSNCDYFSSASSHNMRQRLRSWVGGRRRGSQTTSGVRDTRVHPPQGVVAGQELELQMPQGVLVKDEMATQTMTEQISNEVGSGWSDATMPRLGVLPSMAFSETGTIPGAEDIEGLERLY